MRFFYNRQGSALLVGLIIVVLLMILATSFLEKISRLGKTSAGIENSAQSYTLATGLIEEQLMDANMTKSEPWKIRTKSEGTMGLSSTGRILTAFTGGTLLPMATKGNSPYSSDWNIISIGEPVQLVIPSGVNWDTVFFVFRVPAIPGLTNTGAAQSNSGVILWTFGYSGASLYASGETQIFKGIDINGAIKDIGGYNGITNTSNSMTFKNFYNSISSNCGTNYNCTLKLSMIRPFITLGGSTFPMLEYQINFGSSTIPNQYMMIESSSYMYGYLRNRKIQIPQVTTDTAVDFTVLQ